ncbi:MAG: hypothetical protein ACJ76N_12940 [Thermoanaerobaculia bacterium]
MSPLIDRLAELRRHLDHLRELRPRIAGPEALLVEELAGAVRRIEAGS